MSDHSSTEAGHGDEAGEVGDDASVLPHDDLHAEVTAVGRRASHRLSLTVEGLVRAM
jgi:hypothetical protein